MKSSLCIIKESEGYIKVSEVIFPGGKNSLVQSCQYWERIKSILNFFYPNINQWTGLIHLIINIKETVTENHY